jgi:DNA-binding FadR family transcriptional regulator
MNTQQLTLSDLVQLRNALDLAFTRGAFKGAEARSIGELYENLENFLNAVAEQQRAQQEHEHTNTSLPPVPTPVDDFDYEDPTTQKGD